MDVESNNSIIGTVQLLILVFNKKKGIVCAKKECYHLEVNVYYMALFGTSLDIIAVKLKRYVMKLAHFEDFLSCKLNCF